MSIISYIKDLTFADKEYFWLLCVLPVLIFWYIFRLKKKEAEFNFSSFQQLGPVKNSIKAALRHFVFIFRVIAIALIIVVLARP